MLCTADMHVQIMNGTCRTRKVYLGVGETSSRGVLLRFTLRSAAAVQLAEGQPKVACWASLIVASLQLSDTYTL